MSSRWSVAKAILRAAIDAAAQGQSSYFVWHRGKDSKVIDLATSEDRAVLEAMIAKADVLLQN
jgi:formyl-CoA transferase